MPKPSFIDEVEITVISGDGGDGIVSFLRERARPYGGPNGGNGGRGGDVVMSATSAINTLLAYRYRRRIIAANGGRGMGKDRHGANGADTVLQVPLGTRVIDVDTGGIHADMTMEGQIVVVAAGGRGGIGNAGFKSSSNRAPRMATLGGKGESRCFRLELRLLADIGLLGMPNAGKSTLLRAISAAKPKIADYPFTTLQPHLGLVRGDEYDTGIVVADIPGLIRGAAEGAGLGNRFLRHLSRTALLCQVVDAASDSFADDCRVIDGELCKSSQDGLVTKPRWLVMNKIDRLSADERQVRLQTVQTEFPFFERVLMLSALSGEGVKAAVRAMVGGVI